MQKYNFNKYVLIILSFLAVAIIFKISVLDTIQSRIKLTDELVKPLPTTQNYNIIELD